MTDVRKAGRIISIISASANNEVSHRENHQGFKCFDRPIQFEKREMKILYTKEKVASWSMPGLEYATGRVPWYLNRWLAEANAQYASEVRSEINRSLHKLKREQKGRLGILYYCLDAIRGYWMSHYTMIASICYYNARVHFTFSFHYFP